MVVTLKNITVELGSLTGKALITMQYDTDRNRYMYKSHLYSMSLFKTAMEGQNQGELYKGSDPYTHAEGIFQAQKEEGPVRKS